MVTSACPDRRGCQPRSVLAVIALSVIATGCTTILKSIPADFQPTSENPTVVIARVDFVTRTGETDVTPTVMTRAQDHIKLFVKNETIGRIYVLTAAEGGGPSDFYVAAPPGRYRVREVRFGTLQSMPDSLTFEVPRAPAVYVGTLRFVGEEPSLGARLFGVVRRGRWAVSDGRDPVIERFRARYPGLTDPVVPSLMRFTTASTR